jgi:hypothetical protein
MHNACRRAAAAPRRAVALPAPEVISIGRVAWRATSTTPTAGTKAIAGRSQTSPENKGFLKVRPQDCTAGATD